MRIARILASVASQVHAGTYNLTTRAVSGTTLVEICCVVAHDSRNRVKRKMAGRIFVFFIISFFEAMINLPSPLPRKQPTYPLARKTSFSLRVKLLLGTIERRLRPVTFYYSMKSRCKSIRLFVIEGRRAYPSNCVDHQDLTCQRSFFSFEALASLHRRHTSFYHQ